MIENYDIICFSSAEWNNPFKTNQHHLMQRLSQKNRILFIESLGLRRPVLQKRDITRIFKRLFKSLKGIRKEQNNLFIFAPIVIPFHKYATVRFINNILLKLQLKYVVKKIEFKHPVVWSYVPNAVDFLGVWKERFSVYHCVDELSANPLIPAKLVKDMEQRFLKNVGLTFVTSRPLFENKKKLCKNTYYMPNVADFENFSKSQAADTIIPEDMAKLVSPKIGFFGALSSYKVDFKLIGYIAKNNPKWSIVLIGPTGEGERTADLTILKNQKNVHLMGSRQYGLLPSYLKAFDVCILPSLINEYTRHMFPLKLFEYLSSGKPVVSTALESLSEFGKLCYISKTELEFQANITKAITENNPDLRKERIETSSKYTWGMRIEEMSGVIEAYIKGNV